jgi:hypothetical protein
MTRSPRAAAVAVALALGTFPATIARADLPTPRLLPDLRLTQDKGVESVPEADPWTNRKKTIALQGGVPGGPIGALGVTFEYAPIKYIVLGAGAGWAGNPRGALMPRLRLPLNRWIAVGFGLPFSIGPYEFSLAQTEQCQWAGCATAFRTTRSWTMAAWGHLEPNVEFRLNGGLALRVAGGHSRVLNSESDRCTSTLAMGCPSSIGEQKWYGNIAVGYAW